MPNVRLFHSYRKLDFFLMSLPKLYCLLVDVPLLSSVFLAKLVYSNGSNCSTIYNSLDRKNFNQNIFSIHV